MNGPEGEGPAWRRPVAILATAAVPCLTAVTCLAVILGLMVGRDSLFRVSPLAPPAGQIEIAPSYDAEAVLLVYDLLAKGVGPNDPILYRHPVTTEGRDLEVGLLFVAAAEDDGDLLRLLVEKGADLSLPINARAVCAAVLSNRPYKLAILLDELGADPNPALPCSANGDRPLAAARRLSDPRVMEILLANGALDAY